MLRALRHPNVVSLIDEGPGFLVLEFVPETLHSRIEKIGGMHEAAAEAILDQLFMATHACFQAGWAHMDIKPENCLLKYSDGHASPKFSAV